MTFQYSFVQPAVCAFQFLTRIPLRTNETFSDKILGRSILYYPFVGLTIGLMLVIAGHFLDTIFADSLVAILTLTLWVMITGALHIDGLADTSDAWVGGLGSKQRTLEIMKDPAAGPVGVSAIVLILLIKAFALHALLSSSANFLLLVFSPVLARTAILFLFLTTPYIREKGIGSASIENMDKRLAQLVCISIVFILLLLSPLQAISALIVSGIIFMLLRQAMLKRLNGCTGDTTGAMVEILETGILLALTANLA